MRRGVASRTLWFLGCVASVSGMVATASACSPPPSGWFANGGPDRVPENGVVAVSYGCDTACDAPPDPTKFQLLQGQASVPGAVVLSGGDAHARFLVFRPEPGLLTAGHEYQPVLEGVAYFDSVSVEAPVELPEAPAITETFRAVDHPAGERVCCTGPVNTCGGTPCFNTESDRRAQIVLSWAEADVLFGGQYAFRLSSGDDPGPDFHYNRSAAGYELPSGESRTCYVLTLERLADGATHVYDERCVEAPADLVPGTVAIDATELAGALSYCDAPPPGYTPEWCDAHSAFCPGGGALDCEHYEENCGPAGGGQGGESSVGGGGEPAGQGGSGGSAGAVRGGRGGESNAGRGGAAGAAGRGGGAGTGRGGTTPVDPADAGAAGVADAVGDRVVVTKGCGGCAVPQRTSAPGGALAVVLAGIIARVRRRRRQSRARGARP